MKRLSLKRFCLFTLALGLLYVSGASAQYPVVDAIANKIIQKYQTSTCEQLWVKKEEKAPPSAAEQRAIAILKSDPQMRTEFINKIAAPVANKMFECGMIP
jgi:hypothetical protein